MKELVLYYFSDSNEMSYQIVVTVIHQGSYRMKHRTGRSFPFVENVLRCHYRPSDHLDHIHRLSSIENFNEFSSLKTSVKRRIPKNHPRT